MRQQAEGWHPLFAVALEHPMPLSALRVLAQGLMAEGLVTRAELVEIVDDVHAELEGQMRDADEDAVLDLLDQLTGWTTPGSAI